MRNKVILIKGYANLSKYITLAEFERINADHVVLITALRRPQYLPPEMADSPLMVEDIKSHPSKVLDYWKTTDAFYLLVAEYANIAVDHGKGDVRVVEGRSLETLWYFEAVRAIHKQFGQQVIEVEIIRDEHNITWIKVDDNNVTITQFIEMFKPHPSLG